MERSQAENEIYTIDRDNLPSGEAFPKNFHRKAVPVWLAKHRKQNRIVDHQIIRVACRQPFPVTENRLRHRQSPDFKWGASSGSKRAKTFEVLPESRIIGILLILLNNRHNSVGTIKPGDVINVPIRVIADNSVMQPKDPVDPEILPKIFLDLLAPQTRIPVLVQEAGFRGQQLSRAVDFNRAALQHHRDGEPPEAEGIRDAPRNPVVVIKWRILFPPSVVLPVGDRYFTGFVIFNKDRSVIATPTVIDWMIKQFNPAEVRPRGTQQLESRRLTGFLAVDPHLFETRNHRGDLREPLRDRFKMAWPSFTVDRPRKPDSLLPLPFSGCTESKRRGCIHQGITQDALGFISR